MKKLLILCLLLPLSGCLAAAAVAIPVVMEIYGTGKNLYCENATEAGRKKVKEVVSDGDTLYSYCPRD